MSDWAPVMLAPALLITQVDGPPMAPSAGLPGACGAPARDRSVSMTIGLLRPAARSFGDLVESSRRRAARTALRLRRRVQPRVPADAVEAPVSTMRLAVRSDLAGSACDYGRILVWIISNCRSGALAYGDGQDEWKVTTGARHML